MDGWMGGCLDEWMDDGWEDMEMDINLVHATSFLWPIKVKKRGVTWTSNTANNGGGETDPGCQWQAIYLTDFSNERI